MLMIRPLAASDHMRPKTCTPRKVPVRFVSRIAFQSSSGWSNVASRFVRPAEFTRCRPSKPIDACRKSAWSEAISPTSEADAQRPPSPGLDLGGRNLHLFSSSRCADDVGLRPRQAHARSRGQYRMSLDTTAVRPSRSTLEKPIQIQLGKWFKGKGITNLRTRTSLNTWQNLIITYVYKSHTRSFFMVQNISLDNTCF